MPDHESRSRHELAPQFVVRMAGVPYDVLEPMATPRAIAAAREVDARARALERAARAALEALRRSAVAPSARVEELRRAIGRRGALAAIDPADPPEVGAYDAAARALEDERARHAATLREEAGAGWRALRRAASRFLPDYALFASPMVEALAADLRADGEWAPERLSHRHRDRTLLLYVQRLATKNDSLSAFGPRAAGRVDADARGLRLAPGSGFRRRAFLERWVADAVVSAMNADATTRAEIAPRLHPSARVEDAAVLRLDTGARIPLDPEARALLARCDGDTPAHAVGAPERLAALADAGAILWALETPAFVLDRVGALRARVGRWRDGEARRRWEPRLAALAEIPERFARETGAAARREILRDARELLARSAAAAPPAEGQRTLYRASNLVGEECALPESLVLGADLAREVAERASPWFELWQDTFAFAAHRANEKLRALQGSVAGAGGAAPLPAFLRAAEAAGVPLTGIGIPALAHLAFREVRAAFGEALAGREDAPVWSIGAAECAVVRRRFRFPRFDDLTWPSADLQLAAASARDVASGRHRWVVAELHFAAAVLQHGFPFSLADPAAFGPFLRRVAGPFCDWGFPTDLLSHTMLDLSWVRDLFTYMGPCEPPARWRSFRPADAEVVVAEDGDVRVRAGGADRGSFARSWVLGFGFHPFVFPLGAHSPRLEIGGVVVQREGWVVTAADLPRAPYASGAPALAVDVERLRAARGIPRHVFVRPTEAAVRRLGAGGRDKDAKPIYVDLESYPFLELLARWLAKHGELDVTEMLPAPEDLPWREEGGRRTFELRTLVVPRAMGAVG
ncbi:MAG TPA: hypothetical protein VFL83_19910 [Anaeromyxobacter sp.]|nr:hypothetical protein [Anaeromyxobacter sp.]